MKSGKQRRLEIKENRRKKARENTAIDVYGSLSIMPKNAVKANHDELLHNNTYGPFPLFYVDKEYTQIT